MRPLFIVLVVATVVLVGAVESLLHGGRPGRKPLLVEPPVIDYPPAAEPSTGEPGYEGRHRVSDEETRPINWPSDAELIRPIPVEKFPALPRGGA
jgi:hypothetical protein